jgi:hypothetical protein
LRPARRLVGGRARGQIQKLSSVGKFQHGTPADSTRAAHCNDRDSARPAGSSDKKATSAPRVGGRGHADVCCSA